MKPVIILSGPVGAGKSTVAGALVKVSRGPVVCIEGDKFWPFFAKGSEEIGLQKNFKVMMTSMTVAAIPFARAGYEVIIDFSVPPWFLNTAKAIAKVREVPLDYVVICPGQEVCAARAIGRSEGIITDYEPFKELYASFEDYAKYMINDDKSSPEIIASQIRRGLDKGLFRIN